MVRCADRTLYTGVAKDLPQRIAAHNDGRGAKYTRQRLPVKLVYSEAAADRGAALRREFEIKRLPRAEKRALFANSRAKPRASSPPKRSAGRRAG
ncbi:MAG TPA: GIY-YIG nuclease family protein [Gammaproteobacteria bacterium]|nr:GIY-YIG nuclease family protein [Gammaproteobacteria bacterium]